MFCTTFRIARFWTPVVGLLITALLLSCSEPSKTAVAQAVSEQPFADPAPRTRDADDVARFLAGLPGTPGSPFADLEKEDAWQVHRRELDRAWAHLEAETLPKMRQFQKDELSDAPTLNSTVFYPFSGPDALILTTFFPHNQSYVMVGLEPAGTLPTHKQFARKDLGGFLAKTRETVDSELLRSFFITREMDRHFRGQVTDGLFTPIIHLLVRTNHTILGYRYVRLDEQGKIVERAINYKTSTTYGNKGIEIDFRSDADQSLHKLFYFSVNLSDERLRTNQPFLTYQASLKGATSFFKATSYMTHHPEFSIIRERVLANSGAVLQDDSGIPYHYFTAGSWQVQLYGSYDKPYGSFRWLAEPDLKKAYSVPAGPKPLPFRIGYGFGAVPSNLQFAKRMNAEAGSQKQEVRSQ